MWAVKLPSEQAAALGRLRTRSGIDAAADADGVWLRIAEQDEQLAAELSGVTLAACFEVDDENRLLPLGGRVPVARLPQLAWRPLAEFIAVSLPIAALGGRLPDRVPIGLVRTERVQQPNVLVTTVDELVEYVASAPEVRLQGGRFAACAAGRAVVQIDPLLPLPGERFVAQDGVAIPAGWAVAPAVPAAILAKSLRLLAGDLAILSSQGAVEVITEDQFVRLTRSAVRATRERIA